jgi:hypothetical protein
MGMLMRKILRIVVVLVAGLSLVLASTGTADARRRVKKYATSLVTTPGFEPFSYSTDGNPADNEFIDAFITSSNAACIVGRIVTIRNLAGTAIGTGTTDANGYTGFVEVEPDNANGDSVVFSTPAKKLSKRKLCKGFATAFNPTEQ